ncbi:GNAT family N-acetyltransferase [Chryseobacterium sp. cx-311]|uniref:GNAT family N-acetyltransferase n=1 Tax=Marnyiella aurantia TaxID=2758037 RepID=UPI001AE39BBC|nr:GNAT family N-acetyltransferase [Marnyiella aurantia]MBP0612184.1 GNAT family N-acetyltransferase [Marnyiella aurantia]
MEYLQVSAADDFRAEHIYKSYCSTFPEDERRSKDQFRQLFKNPKVKVLAILNELDNIGYLVLWELTDFVFIEHFEIFSEFRSLKYGSEMLAHLFRTYSHVVLEAEPEHLNDDAVRRIAFYSKNGFSVIDENYVQPCYEEGKNSLQLLLLANWAPEKTDWIKEEIYDVVYC